MISLAAIVLTAAIASDVEAQDDDWQRQRNVEQVVDQLLSKFVLTLNFQGRGIEILVRQERLSVNERLARAIAHSREYKPFLKSRDLRAKVVAALQLERLGIQSYLTSNGEVKRRIDAEVRQLATLYPDEKSQLERLELEIKLNDSVTYEFAESIAHVEDLLAAETTPDHIEARESLKRAIRQALASNPDATEAFSNAIFDGTTCRVMRSRSMVSQLIVAAREAKVAKE